MQQATFSQWTLQELEKTFHLKRHREHPALTEWLEFDAEISPAEQTRLQAIRELVLDEADYWSEDELNFKLIAPLIEMAGYHKESCCVLEYRQEGHQIRPSICHEVALHPVASVRY